MEKPDFGTLLREARERRGLSVAQVCQATKVPEASLRNLEGGDLEALPADIFVRGFIRSYAKSVGISEAEPMAGYERALAANKRARAELLLTPTALLARAEAAEEDGLVPRRGIGLAVFVIIVLLIATITLSLFLRQPSQPGEGLSLGETEAAGAIDRAGPPA
jgi:cytoskeletal protein RodZ